MLRHGCKSEDEGHPVFYVPQFPLMQTKIYQTILPQGCSEYSYNIPIFSLLSTQQRGKNQSGVGRWMEEEKTPREDRELVKIDHCWCPVDVQQRGHPCSVG